MQSIVPIIGHEFVDARPLLRERLEALIYARGYKAHWVNEENITALESSAHAEVSTPIILDLVEAPNEKNHPDLLYPLLEHFRSALLIVEKAEIVPEILFKLRPQLSLWESSTPMELVRSAIKYIYLHLDKDELGVEAIAHETIVSKYKLESEFKKWSGSGVWHFVKHARLSQAKRLLLESTVDISEVAYSVGYSDLPAFDKAFKKYFSINPHKFRAEMKGFIQNDKFIFRNDKFFYQND